MQLSTPQVFVLMYIYSYLFLSKFILSNPTGLVKLGAWSLPAGPVVVLCRRAFQFATLPSHPYMDRDLYYSGLNPTAPSLSTDPRPLGISWNASRTPVAVTAQWIRDQFWFIARRRTSVGVTYYNQKLSRDSYY